MKRDDFTTFRATHPSVQAAVDACDRPDWLILLAWEALDHKAALRVGADTARILLGRSDALRLFTPVPDRLEPIELYAANVDSDARTFQNLRAIATAAPIGGVLAFLLDRFVTSSVWGDSRYTMLSVTIVALTAVFALVNKVVLAAIVRRRAAALDDQAALKIVLDEIGKGAARNPAKIPLVMRSIGGLVTKLLKGATA